MKIVVHVHSLAPGPGQPWVYTEEYEGVSNIPLALVGDYVLVYPPGHTRVGLQITERNFTHQPGLLTIDYYGDPVSPHGTY